MPRFFFDLSDGWCEPDTDGVELADPHAAQREAIRFAGEVLKHEPGRLERDALRILVRTGARETLCAVRIQLIREAGMGGGAGDEPSPYG